MIFLDFRGSFFVGPIQELVHEEYLFTNRLHLKMFI